jgi:hypothetical protein
LANRVCHSACHGQCSGSRKVIVRAWRATFAATLMIFHRMVAPRALARAKLVRYPVARVRLCAMAARASQAALAWMLPEGRCARGPSIRSAKTCKGSIPPYLW